MTQNTLYITTLLIISILHLTTNVSAFDKRGKIEDWKKYSAQKKHLENNTDSTYHVVSWYNKQFELKRDTTSLIESLVMMGDLKKNLGNYNMAYNHTWDALILAEEVKDTLLQVDCHNMLGMLYGIFDDTKHAIHHNKHALRLRKSLYETGQLKEEEIMRDYFSVGAIYGEAGLFSLSKTYLDTCIQIAHRHNKTSYYIMAMQANIAIKEGKLAYAEEKLKQISAYFIEQKRRYEVMIYSYWGDLYTQKKAYKKAKQHYLQCLQAMNRHNVHTDIHPEVLQKISAIYDKLGQNDKAYTYLKESKLVNDSLFSAKNNSDLLEVRNKYQESIQQKNKEIDQQNQQLTERKDQNFRLKVFLSFLVLLIVSGALGMLNWIQRKKFKEDQLRDQYRAKLEKEKHEEIIAIKNREVTSFTLQLINKDQVIDNLLEEIKERVSDAMYRGIRNRSKDFNKNQWEEFNERFIKVNPEFYPKLQKKYPALSPTDIKYCALIKLNFNGQEMAQLLNMSLPSVHIARHRIRKKFGLQRNDNLTEFVGRF